MGRQAAERAARKARTAAVKAQERAEGALREAVGADLEASGAMAPVRSVSEHLQNPFFERCLYAELFKAQGLAAKNEEDVRDIVIRVLREHFGASVDGVLLKIFVDKESMQLRVRAMPPVELARAAVERAKVTTEPMFREAVALGQAAAKFGGERPELSGGAAS